MLSDFSIEHASEKSKKQIRRTLQITLLINFFPLFLGFVSLAINPNPPSIFTFEDYPYLAKILSSFVSVFLSGDLYFYAMSICAGIYVVSQSANQEGNFGMRSWSGVFVLFCAGFMSFFLGTGDSETTAGFLFHGISSVTFLIVASILYYRVLILSEQPPPIPENVNRKEAEEVTAASDPNYD